MRTLQEKYNGVLEGKFSKTQFRRDAAIEMPQFVSTVNSFDDTVAILKNKGAITEAKKQEPKYSTAKPADTIAPDVLDTGIKFELDKKYGTLDVTPEQYEKCKEMAIKNLAKDVLYYVKQDSEQLEAPGEKMEKAKLKEVKSKEANLNEGRYSINLKAAMDALNKSEYVDGVKIRQGNKFTGIKSIDVNTRLIGDLVVTKDGEVFWPYKDRTWGWDSPSIEHLIKTIEEVSAEEELNPSNDYKLTEVNEDVIDELKVKVSIPGQEEFEAEEGKDYSEEEADKYIDNAEKSGATPMNTKFTKVNEEEVEEAIQNIESDDATKRRIARLTNQLLQDADPSDETVKAYAISVKNDLESGDTSRMTQYKDILSLDDLKDDMEHYLSHDVDQLEEIDEMDRNDPIAMRLRAEKDKVAKMRAADAGDDRNDKFFEKNASRLRKIKVLKDKRAEIMRDMEQEAEIEGGPIADRYGDMLNKIDNAISKLQDQGKGDEYMSKDEIERRAAMIKESPIHSTEVEFILPIMHDKLGHPTERPAQSEIIDAAYQALSDWYPGDEVDVRHVEQLEKAYYADFDELVANTPDHSDYEMYENKKKYLKEMFKKIIAKVINE